MAATRTKTRATSRIPGALLSAVAGIVVGAAVAALEMVPAFNYNTVLYVSFMSGSLGVWAVACALIGLRSQSARAAAANSAAFFFPMFLTFVTVHFAGYVEIEAESGLVSLAALHSALFEGSGLVLIGGGLAACGAATFLAWGMHHFRDRSLAYWLCVAVPLVVLVFEGTAYFVPMAVYESIDMLPALVDVAGAFLVSWFAILGPRQVAPASAAALKLATESA